MEEIFSDYIGFIKFGKEVILNILKKSDVKLSEIEELILERKYNKDGEYFALKDEKRELQEVMKPYIELYKTLSRAEETKEENSNDDIEKAKLIIKNLMEINKLEKDKILSEIKKRDVFKGKSGAEVVKTFLEYQLKELKKSKVKLSEKGATLLKEEAELKHMLEDSIQEKESAEILEKLFKKGKEVENIAEKILICEDRIKEIEEDLEWEWKFQIYGTISKEELRNRI
jgi:hypothetical protein